MPSTYYFDESGNTGDLARKTDRLDFGRQPIFVLVCVGIDDNDHLADEIVRLKKLHNVQAAELKSTSLLSKPEFISDIARYLRQRRCPLFVEVVEKHFCVMAHVVDRLILTPVGETDFAPETRVMKNLFAEYLHAEMPDNIVENYIDACGSPSADRVRMTFASMMQWLRRCDAGDEVAQALLRVVNENACELEEMLTSDSEAYRRFLPDPDNNTRGTPLWMLPNLASFANIYGRINLFHGRSIGKVSLVHDEQAHHEHILRDGKALAEKLVGTGWVPRMPHSDYNFAQQATLLFAPSHTSPGIQAADAIAGFVMRYVKDTLFGVVPASPFQAAFYDLLCLTDSARGTGMNFVVTYRDLARLGVQQAV